MSQPPSASSARNTITTPAQLLAFVLERLGETEPFVPVEADAFGRFKSELTSLSQREGETLPASVLLHRLHLAKAPKSAKGTVPYGAVLLAELRSSREGVWHDGFDAHVTIESLAIEALQSWMGDAENDAFIRIKFTDRSMRIRSRSALTDCYGVSIDVTMDADCLG